MSAPEIFFSVLSLTSTNNSQRKHMLTYTDISIDPASTMLTGKKNGANFLVYGSQLLVPKWEELLVERLNRWGVKIWKDFFQRILERRHNQSSGYQEVEADLSKSKVMATESGSCWKHVHVSFQGRQRLRVSACCESVWGKFTKVLAEKHLRKLHQRVFLLHSKNSAHGSSQTRACLLEFWWENGQDTL